MANVSLFTAFDASTLQFSPVQKNKKGGQVVNLGAAGADGGTKRVMIQTPEVAVPFGVSPYMDNNGEVQSYSIDLSFRGADVDPRMADFQARMRRLDEVLLDTAVQRSKEWFGKAQSKDVVAEFLRKLVKDPRDPKYAPTMKVKVPIINGAPASLFYNENREPVGIDYVTKGSTVKMILELSSVWFVNKTFGVTWKLMQAVVVTRAGGLDTYAFMADDDDAQAEGVAPSPAPLPDAA